MWSLQNVPAPPSPTMCAWICLALSDLLSSGESVYTNPESSVVKRLDLSNFRLLLLNSRHPDRALVLYYSREGGLVNNL